ncbi:MAG: hypothetical protein NTY41_15185 [Proteobacteria bacterium]|nr:hypothetical protein [Pseudomonadota bacterium]
MNDKLLERADSLMRRRTFVAGASSEPAGLTGASENEGDISLEEVPVLTEVVGTGASLERPADVPELTPQAALAQQIEAAVHERLAQLLTARQAELTQEIETWLDEQMPQLVIRAMDGITDHLVALLANRARDELLPRLETAMRLADQDLADTDGAE